MDITSGVAHLEARRARSLRSYRSLAVGAVLPHLLKIRYRRSLRNWYLDLTHATLSWTQRVLKGYRLTSILFSAFKARMITKSYRICFKATKLWWHLLSIVLELKILLKVLTQSKTRLFPRTRMQLRLHSIRMQRPIHISVEGWIRVPQQQPTSNHQGTKKRKQRRLTPLILRRLILSSLSSTTSKKGRSVQISRHSQAIEMSRRWCLMVPGSTTSQSATRFQRLMKRMRWFTRLIG